MPGANYMGGKRNAARVKLKDTTSRAQKGFFRRQRLEMLAKGINPSKSSDCGLPEISEITLSHAKRSAMNKRTNHIVINQAWHPAQSHAIPTCDTDTQCRGGSTCDTGQPDQCATSLRSLCDRILATPDLAGLQRNETHGNQRNLMEPVYSKKENLNSPVSLSVSSSIPSSCTRQSWSSVDCLDGHVMKDTDSTYFNDQASVFMNMDKSPRTPVSRYRKSPSFLPSYRTPSTGSEGWSPKIVTKLSPSLLGDLREDKDTDTQKYMRFQNDHDTSGAKSTRHIEGPVTPQQSAGRNIAMSRCGSGNTSIHLRSLSMDTSPFTWSETPEVSPSAKALHRASASDQLMPLPGCIFDYEDPWDTIGIIMGLPRTELRCTTLEEELTTLGANGHVLSMAVSDEGFRLGADILTESYSDSTSSIRFGSQEFKYGQESQISDGIRPHDLEDQSCNEVTLLTKSRRRSSGSLISAEDGSMHEDSSIDYVTLGLYEDRFASSLDQASSGSVSPPHEVQLEPSIPCREGSTVPPIRKHSPLLVQSTGLPTDDTVTENGDLPYTKAESDREIPSITHVLAPGHPVHSLSLRSIDGDYGPNLFSDDSDVESP